jgi:8-oxo-dGTP pyrophosphatase MutT (NUDIX family)
MNMNTYNAIASYSPFNAQEASDQRIILDFIRKNEDAYLRTNRVGHMTASAWVVNSDFSKVLMGFHRIYNSWSWLGGHCDGDDDLLGVAVREVQEESGISDVIPISDEIYSLEVLTVDGHEKHGQYVSSHLHLNVSYLLQADDKAPLKVKEDENKAVSWFAVDEAIAMSSEPWFREHIYSKLNEKLKMLQSQL